VTDEIHPLVAAAGGAGELPAWAACRPWRRAHAARVAALLDDWGARLGRPEAERVRWRAAGHLHDALKDAPADELRALAGSGLPEPVLHGPACAARLAAEGVGDRELLDAVAWHSTGHPEFAELGELLFLADFLEPGRASHEDWRTGLRDRMPEERAEVLVEVLRWRIDRLLERGSPVLVPSVELWNRAVGR
jgi:HD superfamily phosphohydrolase YqeK